MGASVVAGKETEGAKFKDYFEFSEPFDQLPSHRILALLRGENEGVLQLNLDAGEDEVYEGMIAERFDLAVKDSKWLSDAVHWGWRTKLYTSSGRCAHAPQRNRGGGRAQGLCYQPARRLVGGTGGSTRHDWTGPGLSKRREVRCS